MVKIVPNWADIVGDVDHLRPNAQLDGFTQVGIRVREATSVEGTANMFADSVGRVVEVNFPDNLVREHGIKDGVSVDCRIRRADLDNSFVHPQHVAVRPGGG